MEPLSNEDDAAVFYIIEDTEINREEDVHTWSNAPLVESENNED